MVAVGDRRESVNFGWMEVISPPYESGTTRNDLKVDVKFDNTGNVREGVLTKMFLLGAVRDGSVSFTFHDGLKFKTTSSGIVEVLRYFSKKEVTIKFESSGEVQEKVQWDQILLGVVKDPTTIPLVYGSGVYSKGKYKASTGNKTTREYNLWAGMLERCLKRQAYEDCEVDKRFLDFQYFAEWCNQQVGFSKEGFEIDKDLLSSSAQFKSYSPENCVFVPAEINLALVLHTKRRGDYLPGVSKVHNKYQSMISIKGVPKYLGTFATELEAFLSYKTEKEKYLGGLAEKYKEDISINAYRALKNFKIFIDS